MNPTKELAVWMGSVGRPTLRRLLDAGADIDVQDEEDNWTLLMRAVEVRILQWCTELLKRGASLHVQDHYGWTAWDLLDSNEDDTPLYSLLLQYGADVNHYDPNGLTALHWACLWNHRSTIVFLFAQGADPRLRVLSGFHKGQTAYDLGTFWCTPEGRNARLRWDTVSIQEVFILASELGLVPIPSYLW